MNYEELLGTFQGHPVVIQSGGEGGEGGEGQALRPEHCLDF